MNSVGLNEHVTLSHFNIVYMEKCGIYCKWVIYYEYMHIKVHS